VDFKAINKRCSKDLQAAVDGYCKFWVKEQKIIAKKDFFSVLYNMLWYIYDISSI
jgi:hypothetical protein